MAALAAARAGLKVRIVEQSGCLGGALTVMGVHPMMTFHNKAGRQLIGGLAQELVDRLIAAGGSPGHIPDSITYNSTVTPFEAERLKTVLDDMAAEAGVEVLFHTLLVSAERAGARLKSVTLANRGGLARAEARVFIDATGDADLAACAGVPCVMGRGDGVWQPLTMNFTLANVDMAAVRAYAHAHPEEFWFKDGPVEGLAVLDRTPRVSLGGYRLTWQAAKARGEADVPREDILFFETATPGVVVVNTTRVQGLDPTDPAALSRAEAIGRRQVRQVYDFLRNHAPGFGNALLVGTPARIGVREGRHPVGLHVLTADDLVGETRFPDPVLQAGYPIDIHAPRPGEESRNRFMRPDAAYQVPLRSLLVAEPVNLVLAGRAISATHESSAAIRVTPIAMALGQAAGTLAALAAKTGDATAVPYSAVRAELEKQGVPLPAGGVKENLEP
jgi:hypothetical protein